MIRSLFSFPLGLAAALLALTALVAAPAAADHDGAVTFYDSEGFQGRSESFDGDVDDLARTRIGNDRVRSLQLAPGCQAVLYEHARFRGRSFTVRSDVASLDRTPIGLDALSSFQVRCDSRRDDWDDDWGGDDWDDRDGWDDNPWEDDPGEDDVHYHDDGTVCRHDPGYHDHGDRGHDRGRGRGHDRGWDDGYRGELRRGEGVVIFSEDGFEGRATLFSGDVRDLNGTYVGNDTASSILVAPGCKAILYEHQDFRGISVEVTYDLADLGSTRLRDDRLSSLQLDCRGGWDADWGSGGGPHGGGHGNQRAPLILYEHQNFTGKSREITGDVADLNHLYMNDLVTSLRLARGCEVVLYEHQNYRGKSRRVTGDVTDLNRLYMNDLVTSLQLECRRR